jgi:hypothetical protein
VASEAPYTHLSGQVRVVFPNPKGILEINRANRKLIDWLAADACKVQAEATALQVLARSPSAPNFAQPLLAPLLPKN